MTTTLEGYAVKQCSCGSLELSIQKDGIWKWVQCDKCGELGPFDLGVSGAVEQWNEQKEAK